MEAAVKKLEANYRGQMKERVEMLRERTEGGLRAEVEAELIEKLSSEMQERLKAERTKLEEQLRQGLGRRAHEDLVWVRHDILRVLDWERGMMQEQVGRATGQVREWVVRDQRINQNSRGSRWRLQSRRWRPVTGAR